MCVCVFEIIEHRAYIGKQTEILILFVGSSIDLFLLKYYNNIMEYFALLIVFFFGFSMLLEY